MIIKISLLYCLVLVFGWSLFSTANVSDAQLPKIYFQSIIMMQICLSFHKPVKSTNQKNPYANKSHGYNVGNIRRPNATVITSRPSAANVTVINVFPSAPNIKQNYTARPIASNGSAHASRPPVQNIVNVINNLAPSQTPHKKPSKSSANYTFSKQSHTMAVILCFMCLFFRNRIISEDDL